MQQSKWITSDEFLKKYSIRDFELLILIKKGLQPYSRYRKEPLYCPPKNHLSSILEEIISQSYSFLDEFERLEAEHVYLKAKGLKVIDFEYDQYGALKVIENTPFAFLNMEDEFWDRNNFSDPEWKKIESQLKNQKLKSDYHEKNIAYFDYIFAAQKHVILKKIRKIVEDNTKKVDKMYYDLKIRDPGRRSWEFFVLPKDKEKLQNLSELIQNSIFKTDELKYFEEKHEICSKVVDHVDKSGIASQDQERIFRYAFVLNGEYWEIRYRDKETKLQNLERIRYIIHLLDNPGEEFASHRLTSLVKSNEPLADPYYKKLSEKQLQKEGLSQPELLTNGLTEEDFQKFKKTARTIWDRCVTSPDEEKAKEDWEKVKRLSLNEYGIVVDDSDDDGLKFFKQKRLKVDMDKARSNVSKQIAAAIKSLEETLPSLAEYLKRHISRGAICIYKPDTENKIDWNIRW